MVRGFLVLLMTAAVAVATTEAKKPPAPAGVIAASSGESVVVADPDGRWSESFDTGTVGWLFPAPAGVLFAPDLTAGRTTVLDLRSMRVVDRMDGVTMPHFGRDSDRYVVVAGEVMLVSYPDRAVLSRFGVGIEAPWQVIVISNVALLILERSPDGEGGSTLVALDPISRQVVYRRRLGTDVRRMALSSELGLLAMADASGSRVRLVEPATLNPVAGFPVGAPVLDVGFIDGGRSLVAVSGASGAPGAVHLWTLKWSDDGLKVKRSARVELSSAPVRMAVSPNRPSVAVGLETARIAVVDLGARQARVTAWVELPAAPRDVIWCDPATPGPTVPEWSDTRPPEFLVGEPRP